MTDIDIDAIRQREQAADPAPWTAHPDGLVWSQLIGDPVSGSALVENAEFIAAARTAVPALLAKVDKLTAERDEYAADNTRVVAQLVAANHHADGLKADLRSANTANTAYANENARLRSQLAEADVVIGSMRAAIDEADAEAVAR